MATEGSLFLDVNALKSVENIRRVIGQYREEQEQLMKKMSQDSSRGVSLAKDVASIAYVTIVLSYQLDGSRPDKLDHGLKHLLVLCPTKALVSAALRAMEVCGDS